ncbi:sialin-like [Ornithodoros turicata]|uniref:sialin-like n=1 Tax=Ornithodoros turicata TaxID=34597 RepID=UPI003138BC7A
MESLICSRPHQANPFPSFWMAFLFQRVPQSLRVRCVSHLPRNTLATPALDEATGNMDEFDASNDSVFFSVRMRKRKMTCVRYRYLTVLLLFCALFLTYAMRVNLNVAIIAMVNNTAIAQNGTSQLETGCPADHNATSSNRTYIFELDGEFVWDEVTQGYVLDAFFYGYTITQLPGGWLAENVNNKLLFGIAMLLTSLLTIATAPVVRWSVYAFYALRALEGLAQGLIYPSLYALLARWAPVQERNLLMTLCNVGALVGTVVTLPVSAVLCENGFDGGWPSVFYTTGMAGCIWFVCWITLASEAPEKHPHISEEEKAYIMENRGALFACNRSVPWRSILTSPSVWVYTIAKFSTSWSFYTLLINLPTYLENILHFQIKNNSFLSASVNIGQLFIGIIFSYIADRLTEGKSVSVTCVRKTYISVSLLLQAACLLGITWARCDVMSVCSLLLVSSVVSGTVYAADMVLPVDLAPEFAGNVMGLANMICNISGIFTPMVVGYLTEKNQTVDRWNMVFYIASGINIIGSLIFVLFGSAEVQPWAVLEPPEDTEILTNGDAIHSEQDDGTVHVY